MKITFLGTGAMFPTKKRNHSGIFLHYKNHGLLFDCGENIQRQFMFSNEKITKTTKIFISHWHGDHVYGLPGFLDNLSASEYQGTLEIYGPKGTKSLFQKMLQAFPSSRDVHFKFIEFTSGVVCEEKDFLVEAYSLKHTINSVGYKFVEKDKRKINVKLAKKFNIPQGPIMKQLQSGKDIFVGDKKIDHTKVTELEKGRVVSYIADTQKCPNAIKLAKDADVVISESTFSGEKEALAKKYKHLTSKQAAEIAKNANAKKLVLTHFSQRYKDVKELVKEAKKIFKNTIAAEDFTEIEL